MSVTEESRAISRGVFYLLFGLAAVFMLVATAVIGLVFQQATRTRRGEIAVRRAIGAEPGDILKQIWVEGLLVSATGGVIGLILGLIVSWGLGQWWHVPFAFDVLVLLVPPIAVLFTSLAGLLPARAAARLDPAEALRPAA